MSNESNWVNVWVSVRMQRKYFSTTGLKEVQNLNFAIFYHWKLCINSNRQKFGFSSTFRPLLREKSCMMFNNIPLCPCSTQHLPVDTDLDVS